MELFETLDFEEQDLPLLTAVRAHGVAGRAWSINTDVGNLRSRLLTLQGYRCAYCQVPIDRDEVGHRELDHILPKSASSECTQAKGKSNAFGDRQHTFGYGQFTFEPYNLILTCKACNAFKKSFDPMRDRQGYVVSDDYPDGRQLLWFYPYSQRYSDHIERGDDWIYSKVTDEGDAVIRTCKLDKVAVLTIRFQGRALALASNAGNLRLALMALGTQVAMGNCSKTDAHIALVDALLLDEDQAIYYLNIVTNYLENGNFSDLEKIERLMAAALERAHVSPQVAADVIATVTH
ncbi:hypothetical protein DA83_19445 [Pseudomonas sp. 250J]|uniref:HNH endonuclease n=1 Tax=Pseudomonas peradeniyensis TaxID=2745488 RepID=A0ABT2VGS7_9PSED|nr:MULTISPECIES: HNH endonuclease domain-containing protein [Pseudomonas]KNX78946.1 hypothetical protein DA83_19445 [Pseudomonas sp. 250J]MCU7240956.1 hypothetical protein [Pseudomonas peradeniyensis]QZA53074.1 hypothetical protein K2O50_19035 [Pseudomonas sp. 2hn]